MNTSAISNLANLASGTTPAAKAPGAVSDAPFSQVLSREMAAQPKPSEPAKASKAQNDKESQSTESAANESKPVQQSDAAASSDSTSPENAARSAKSDKAASSTSARADEDKDQDDDVPVSAESEQLLALVASLTQPVAKQADTKTGDDSKQAALDASDDGSAQDKQAKDILLLAQAGQPQNAPQELVIDPAKGRPTFDKIEIPSLPGQNRVESASPQPVGAAASTARRGVINAADERAKATGTSEEVSSEPDEFRTKLAQAKDEKTAADSSATTAQPSRSELPATQSADHQSAPKLAQHAEQPTVAPFTMNAAPAAQPQPLQAMAAQASDMLSPRVGSQGWDKALSQKVVWMVGSDVQSASLTLNPPDLGPLQVVLHVSENQATANFTAAQPEVRHALEAAMPKLREMLGDAGIQLGQANVNAGNPNSNPQNAFEQPQQSSRRGSGAASESSDKPPVRVGRTQTITGGEGLVDTFA